VDAVDSSSDYSSSAWDGARDEPDAAVVAHWPDGTAITESQWRAPVDPRELLPDQRRYFRQLRWVERRSRIGHALSSLGSPRGVIAILLAAALLAASVVTALGAVR
jgi:hypothetical protein